MQIGYSYNIDQPAHLLLHPANSQRSTNFALTSGLHQSDVVTNADWFLTAQHIYYYIQEDPDIREYKITRNY